jgi:hypothetical protein
MNQSLKERISVAFKSGGLLAIPLFITEVAIVCTSPAFQGRRGYEFWMISLFAIVGATVGWFLGIVLSPRDQDDKRFVVASSALASFFSGFLISKLNTGFKLIFGNGSTSEGGWNKSTFLIRATFALAWFLIGLAFTFLTRTEQEAR